MAEVQAQVHVGVSVSVGELTITLRSYFSRLYLWSAEHHARLAADVEAQPGTSPGDYRHRTYVITAVTDSVAFLEGLVNEIYQDAFDTKDTSPVASLGDRTRQRLRGYWEAGERDRILDKYSAALRMADLPPMDSGAEPGQSVRLLVSLRNYLAHYKPKDRGDYIDPEKLGVALERHFQTRKIAGNSIMAGGNPWFPDHTLGAGCARWAHTSARAFADEWCSRLGLSVGHPLPAYQIPWDEKP